MKKPIIFLLSALVLWGCQDNNKSQANHNADTTKQESTLANKNNQANHKIDPTSLLQVQKLELETIVGQYPNFNESKYDGVNQSINALIRNLTEQTGVGKITVNYQVFMPNDNLITVKILYDISDMTERKFEKSYTANIETGKQVLLDDYFAKNNVDKTKVNNAINEFITPCRNEKDKPAYCDEGTVEFLLNAYETIDIKYYESFYLIDNEHIGIAFNSNKFTTNFKVNSKTYAVGFL